MVQLGNRHHYWLPWVEHFTILARACLTGVLFSCSPPYDNRPFSYYSLPFCWALCSSWNWLAALRPASSKPIWTICCIGRWKRPSSAPAPTIWLPGTLHSGSSCAAAFPGRPIGSTSGKIPANNRFGQAAAAPISSIAQRTTVAAAVHRTTISTIRWKELTTI